MLAYGGLVTACARGEPAANPAWWRRAGAAWRAFRGRHLAAGVILAVFALPLAVDLFRGANSNFAAILHHLRTHHGDHKSLLKSLFYFLQFGAATPYEPGRVDFGHFDGAGMFAYLRGHAVIYVGWALAVVLVIVAAGRGRFLAWAGGFLLAAIVLTLIWGTMQDGEMFYYNSWLNFAVYYFGLLIVIAEFAAGRDARARWPWLELAAVALVAGWLGTGFLMAQRVRDPVPETTARLHASIQRVLAATPDEAARGRPAVLEFPAETWPLVAAVGLEMARAGRPFEVGSRWADEFGGEHVDRRLTPRRRAWVLWRFQAGPDTRPWRSDAPEALAAPTGAAAPDFPLIDDVRLATAVPTLRLDGDGAADVDFRRGGNATRYQVEGWSDAEPWGTWTDGPRSTLLFAATGGAARSAAVEMTVELHPFVAAGLTSQRLQVRLNGEPLGPEQRVAEGTPPLLWTIPADRWNTTAGAETGALLEFELPDAASPAALDRTGRTGDARLLGVGVGRVRFRAVPPGGSTLSCRLAVSGRVVL